jgi:hypothetical protein
VYAGIVWGILGVVAEVGAPELAAAFGVGFLLALGYNYFTKTGAFKSTLEAHATDKGTGPAGQAAPVVEKG